MIGAPLLALLCISDCPGDEIHAADVRAVVAEFLATEMADHHVPGAAFSFIAEGRVVVLEGYGVGDLATQAPIDPVTSVFRVGSISKSVTAAALLQCVDRGELDLDVNVNSILGAGFVPETSGPHVTAHQLLTHTAGFGERMLGQHVRAPGDLLSLESYLELHLPRRIAPSGMLISYNDHGTALAGLLVEKLSGSPYAQAVEAALFAPLDMVSSTFEQVHLPATVSDHLVLAYRFDGTRHLRVSRDYIQTSPAAGLYSSARDLGRFTAALLEGGEFEEQRILSEASTRTMLSSAFRHEPNPRGRALGFAETWVNGRHGLKKSGQASGFNAQIYLLPDERTGWVSMTNLSIFEEGAEFGPVAGLHDRLAQTLLDAFFPELPHEDPEPLDPSLETSGQTRPLSGRYRQMSDPRDTWDGVLIVHEWPMTTSGNGALSFRGLNYVEVSPHVFKAESGAEQFLRFYRDLDGQVRWAAVGSQAFERVPWHASHLFLRWVGRVLVGFLLLAPVVAWLVAKRRLRVEDEPCPGGWLIHFAAILLLGFALGFREAAMGTDIQVLFSGPTPWMLALLGLPLISGAACTVGTIRLAHGWFAGRGSRLARVHCSALLFACIGALLLLDQWNLLGWRL